MQCKFNFISSITCNNYCCTSAFGMILRIEVRICTLAVGTPFPLLQKCLWERRSHTKIFMGTVFPRVPAPLHPWIYCDRSVTKDCNQSRTVPLTPNSTCARLQRTEWSTASNAADISSASSTEQFPSPATCSVSLTTFKSAVSVE